MRKLAYTREALRDLKQLEKSTAKRITTKIDFFSRQTDLKPYSKILVGHPGLLRFRVGDYRVIFRETPAGDFQILLILRVKHRKDIYDL